MDLYPRCFIRPKKMFIVQTRTERKRSLVVTFATLYVEWPIAYANGGIENRSGSAAHNVGRTMRALYESRAISMMRQQTG